MWRRGCSRLLWNMPREGISLARPSSLRTPELKNLNIALTLIPSLLFPLMAAHIPQIREQQVLGVPFSEEVAN